MSFIIREKWIWIIIGLCILILVLPWAVLWVILQMPTILAAVFAWTLIISWGVVAGYKDWLMDAKKRKSKVLENR